MHTSLCIAAHLTGMNSGSSVWTVASLSSLTAFPPRVQSALLRQLMSPGAYEPFKSKLLDRNEKNAKRLPWYHCCCLAQAPPRSTGFSCLTELLIWQTAMEWHHCVCCLDLMPFHSPPSLMLSHSWHSGGQWGTLVGALSPILALEHREASLMMILHKNMINIISKVPLPEISKLFTEKVKIGLMKARGHH